MRVDLWKDENIYTMTGLDSFREPRTVPHDYKVTLLTIQYRSVPSIGRVFSEFAYEGMLASHRLESQADRHFLGEGLCEHPINLIAFPVSTYESVYKPKRLNRKSAYQPYSALLTFELVRHTAQVAEKQAPSRNVSVGVVTPYRAQADLIFGLLAQLRLPSGVRVQSGTIHGFQGDECDVMIVVLNTPPAISTGGGMFLNKRNILNVSISRARDSLVLLVPDSDTRGRENLREANRLEMICTATGNAHTYASREIEDMLFESPTHIEDSCFTTGHQSVNVYGRPEQQYEIRSEGHAVDIQVYDAQERRAEVRQTQESPVPVMTSARKETPSLKQTRERKPHVKASSSHSPSRKWTQEEMRTLRAKYGMYSNLPRSLLMAFPGWSLHEIDDKALELGIISAIPFRGL